MKQALSIIRRELFDSWFGLAFMLAGLVVQYVAYCTTGASLLSFVSGSAGVISVVLCSQKKFLFYAFGWTQLITYVILAYEQRLYGELAENAFYAVMMIIGMWTWLTNYNKETSEVETKRMDAIDFFVWFGFMSYFIIMLYGFLLQHTDDTQPLMDSITTVPAFIGQILLTFRYREQWLFWLIIDVGSVAMWLVAGDWCMAAQFVFWTLNCIYGYYKWSK